MDTMRKIWCWIKSAVRDLFWETWEEDLVFENRWWSDPSKIASSLERGKADEAFLEQRGLTPDDVWLEDRGQGADGFWTSRFRRRA